MPQHQTMGPTRRGQGLLRVSEVYPSVQGEGPNVGKPTVFVRFGGCNLRCALWPCDTPHAIFPEYRNEWEQVGPGVLIDRATVFGIDNICMTGGEPMLQNKGQLQTFVNNLSSADFHLEMFSNGTLPYPPTIHDNVSIVMDWKLPGSGEDPLNAARINNFNRLTVSRMNHSVKFTIANWDDFELAHTLWARHKLYMYENIEVFAGVVWGKLENEQLVEWILKERLPWRLNVQVHNHIWDRTKRGI